MGTFHPARFGRLDDFLHSRLAQIGGRPRVHARRQALEITGGSRGNACTRAVVSAWAATIIQLVCSLFIVGGLFTRLNAVLLTGALSGAILQNVLAGRDPQLAILYTLVVVTIALVGGGRFSLDAVLNKRCGHVGQGTA